MGEGLDVKELRKDNFENLEKTVFDYVCKMGREITSHILEELDFYLMKNRDRKRYKSKQTRRTIIKTVYGEVEYSRRMYYDTKERKYVYLLDDNMEMEKVGSVSTNLAKQIVNATMDMPYRKASETISKITGQSISSHGAWNVTQRVGLDVQLEEKQLVKELKNERPRGNEETRVLFQEADGVYINIQENKKKGKSQEIKLSTIYEGWEENGKKLHNKMVFAGLEPAGQFNLKTEALIQSVYNIDETELRVLNGDGATWIKKTYDSERVYQLDRFHIIKEIRRCIPEKKICNMIIGKFKNNDMDGMLNDIEIYIDSIDDDSNKNKVTLARNLFKYLSNNYEGLLPWQKQVENIPSAPEGITYKNMGVQENQNCSLVTMRMKGRKMRWSTSGANNLVKLIYMRENGQLDRLIAYRDGYIDIPEESYFDDFLSSTKVNKKIGKGSKYVDIFNSHMPLLSYATTTVGKTLRNISN